VGVVVVVVVVVVLVMMEIVWWWSIPDPLHNHMHPFVVLQACCTV